jgi:hypothetical protein
MTTTTDPRLMPAQTTTHSDEEEVKDMAFLESRRGVERARDEVPEISEIDRAVILESLRQRRRMRQQQLRIHSELFGLRANR